MGGKIRDEEGKLNGGVLKDEETKGRGCDD